MLLGRCEIIQYPDNSIIRVLYMHDEKLRIARRFLLSKQVAQNGLSEYTLN